MKKIAILVIAATNKPVYEYFIRNYWTELIHHTRSMASHVDVFLLFERKFDTRGFRTLQDNIIKDDNTDYDRLCDRRFHSPQVPGILSKTVFALEQLQDHYDVFFRTNLSSVIRLTRFDCFVQQKKSIGYSGAFVWANALRDDLLAHNRVGPGKCIESLDALAAYPGNTFVSGSGFFLNQQEARQIVRSKHRLLYAIPDDVAIGLMLPTHETLQGFTLIVKSDTPVKQVNEMIASSDACQVRLQHLPLGMAQRFWDSINRAGLWL